MGLVASPSMHLGRGEASRYVAVIGPAEASDEQIGVAHRLGRALAEEGAVVVTGGYGGVMGAAAGGAASAGGTSVGLLSGADRDGAHPANTVTIPTGLGEMRNALVVRAADAVVAVGGSWGTLSEVALAVRTEVPVAALGGWELPAGGVVELGSVEEAVRWATTVAR